MKIWIVYASSMAPYCVCAEENTARRVADELHMTYAQFELEFEPLRGKLTVNGREFKILSDAEASDVIRAHAARANQAGGTLPATSAADRNF